MISYIDEYNDNVEKQCIMKNKKNKEKQRNGLLNPNLKFSSSLNAFIPPDDKSPKINKSDFINIIKSSFETLGKEPPTDVEMEDAFMNLSELDIEALIQILDNNADGNGNNENGSNGNGNLLSPAQQYSIGRQIANTLALTFPDLFDNDERNIENDSASDWSGSSSSGFSSSSSSSGSNVFNSSISQVGVAQQLSPDPNLIQPTQLRLSTLAQRPELEGSFEGLFDPMGF